MCRFRLTAVNPKPECAGGVPRPGASSGLLDGLRRRSQGLGRHEQPPRAYTPYTLRPEASPTLDPGSGFRALGYGVGFMRVALMATSPRNRDRDPQTLHPKSLHLTPPYALDGLRRRPQGLGRHEQPPRAYTPHTLHFRV